MSLFLTMFLTVLKGNFFLGFSCQFVSKKKKKKNGGICNCQIIKK